MKIKYKNKEYEIHELTTAERLDLIGHAGTALSNQSGKSSGEHLVRVFELSGLKDSDFEGLDELEHIELIRTIQDAWKVSVKK